MAAENILASSSYCRGQSCPASPTCPVSVLSCHYRLSCDSTPSCHTAKKQCSMDMSLEDVPYYKQYAVMIPKDYIRGLCSKLFLLITTVTSIKGTVQRDGSGRN